MRVGRSRLTTRTLIAALALVALALRALIPSGFMPAPGRLFSLELCPDGLPAAMQLSGVDQHPIAPGMLYHHGGSGHAQPGAPTAPDQTGTPLHGRHSGEIEHCVFGGASTAALLAQVPVLGLLQTAGIPAAAAFAPQRTSSPPVHGPFPRGPPAHG